MTHPADAFHGFHNAFAAALLDRPANASQIAALTLQPGFAVYRNTVIKGCIDALQANYPAVARLIGDDWFRAAAAVYAAQHLPDTPALMEYGAGFSDFLAHFEPAAELPWLPAVARLDRLWTEVHLAADEPVLDPAELAALPADTLAAAVLQPRAATRWAWFDEVPAYSLWSRNRDSAPLPDGWQPEWQAEGALLTREDGAVRWQPLTAAGCALLDACAAGAPVADAAEAALITDPAADLQTLMAALLTARAFSGVIVPGGTSHTNAAIPERIQKESP